MTGTPGTCRTCGTFVKGEVAGSMGGLGRHVAGGDGTVIPNLTRKDGLCAGWGRMSAEVHDEIVNTKPIPMTAAERRLSREMFRP